MVRRPYQTYADQSRPPIQEVWRAIRELRATPPGHATTSARKKTFTMALEQAEQLFKAARNVEPAARPLLIFYGLSQAGRAIAACTPVRNDQFKLSGHGITTNNLDQADLGQVRVVDTPTGAFKQLADMLGSRSLPAEAPLRDLWATIFELEQWPLAGSTLQIATVSMVDIGAPAGQPLRIIVDNIPRRIIDVNDQSITEAAIRAWLAQYPALDGYGFVTAGGIPSSGPRSWNDQRDTFGCDLEFAVSTSNAWDRFEQIVPFADHLSKRESGRIIHPRLGGDDRQLHPLLRWWSVLFALSMLARYNPDQWISHIDVNSCKNAVAIEVLLEKAMETVPELVLATIEDVV